MGSTPTGGSFSILNLAEIVLVSSRRIVEVCIIIFHQAFEVDAPSNNPLCYTPPSIVTVEGFKTLLCEEYPKLKAKAGNKLILCRKFAQGFAGPWCLKLDETREVFLNGCLNYIIFPRYVTGSPVVLFARRGHRK